MRFRPVSAEVDGEIFEEEVTQERVEKSMKRVDSYEPRKVERLSSSDEEVSELIGDVLKQKKVLENSITHLNESLNRIGFELRPIQK